MYIIYQISGKLKKKVSVESFEFQGCVAIIKWREMVQDTV